MKTAYEFGMQIVGLGQQVCVLAIKRSQQGLDNKTDRQADGQTGRQSISQLVRQSVSQSVS